MMMQSGTFSSNLQDVMGNFKSRMAFGEYRKVRTQKKVISKT